VNLDNANLSISIHNNGSHNVTIHNTKGEILLSTKGTGDAFYQFNDILERGVYFIKVDTRRPEFQSHSQVFTVY